MKNFIGQILIKKSLITLTTIMILFGSFNGEEVSAQTGNKVYKVYEIDQFIQSKMEKNNIPGASVAITHKDKVIFSKGYGQTADKIPVTSDTPFPIASLSKSFTALAVMQLVEDGRVNLDKPVVNYISSLNLHDKKGSKITVRHLLNQTSGLTDRVNPDMTLNPQPNSLKAAIDRLKNVDLASEPGQKYHYHNPNYQILARLVEVVSKEKFSDYLTNHIFKPLDMKHTYNVTNTNELNKSDKLSSGHFFLFGKPVAVNEPEWFIDGPAGIVSTADDMANWLISQQNGGLYKNIQILSSSGIQIMQTSASSEISYGMGWNIGETEDGQKQVQHSGILWTYKAEEVLLPEDGYGVVMLFNSGINTFVDYSSFTNGITELLANHPLEESFFGSQFLEIGMIVLIALSIILEIRNFLHIANWERKYKKRPKWRSFFYLIVRLIPFFLLILIPSIITFIGGGRVLNMKGILMTMPSIIIWLGIVSVMSLIIVISRMIRIVQMKK
ncbi:serine hydrolase domain-containing protein [Cytobacillus praedii]|uniref:serine hydrolase domain-containing protein n=1 Tax=Cytobacillus praedii TaxID=1742358 RepID=UPI003F7DC8F0